MVKRVVGVEGDTVACDAPGAAMTVNGRPITSRSAGSEQACIDAFSVTVTKNAVWVLGDNFNHSLDSRNGLHFGSPFIPLSSVLGKVRAIAWPLNRWQRL